QTSAAADYSFPCARRIPGEPKTGSEIIVIAVVRCAYPFANLLQPGGRIEIAQQVVVILYYCVQFVARSKIQRERLSDAPVVLQEAGITPIMDLPCGIADQLAPLIRYPGEEVFQRRSEEHTSELQSPDHLVCRLQHEQNVQ